jgi:hypothetical protein
MNTDKRAERTRDDLADGRNGRVVGEKDDNLLESIGKAIVAPIEGADEDAAPAGDAQGRPFTDLTQTLPQGQSATQDPTVDKPQGKGI